MGGTDLVVPVGTNEQQVLQIRASQEILEQVERCCVQPLQIVEKQRQRMLVLFQHTDESSKDQLKASLRFLWRQLGHRRLFTNDVLQFRDELHNQLSVRVKRLPKRITPFAQVGFVLAQEWTNEALESLRQRRIRDVPFV